MSIVICCSAVLGLVVICVLAYYIWLANDIFKGM